MTEKDSFEPKSSAAMSHDWQQLELRADGYYLAGRRVKLGDELDLRAIPEPAVERMDGYRVVWEVTQCLDELVRFASTDECVRVSYDIAVPPCEDYTLNERVVLHTVLRGHGDGWSVRDIATTVGLSATRVHQLLADPGAAMVSHACSALRELGWPAPEDPGDHDSALVADRLGDEAALLVTCAEWLEQLAAGAMPVVNLRPHNDWPDTDNVAVDQPRVLRILRRIAADIDELARARRVADVSSAGVDADPRLRRRRRLAEPAIEPPSGPMSIYQARRAWDAYERRLQRAGLPIPPNPYRHLSNGR